MDGRQEAPVIEKHTTRLRELADDLDRYEKLSDPTWRHEMQRAVLVEVRVLAVKLEQEVERERA
jgi:hypothetical protein